MQTVDALVMYLRNKDHHLRDVHKQLDVAGKKLLKAKKELRRAEKRVHLAETVNMVRLAQAGALHARGAMEAIFSILQLRYMYSMSPTFLWHTLDIDFEC